MPLPSGTVTGNLYEITGATIGSELAPEAIANAQVTLVPNIKPDTPFVVWEDALYKVNPIPVVVGEDGGLGTVRVLANDPDLSITNLQWRADIQIGTGVLESFWFDAPDDGGTVDLATVARVARVSVHSLSVSMEMVQSAIAAALEGIDGVSATIELAAGTGNTATDTSVIQAALAAATEGGTVKLHRGSTYNVSALSLSGKSITLDGNGATIVATADSTALTFNGGWEWIRTISGISEVTWNSMPTTRLTVSSVTNLAVGDVVRLVSDDTLPYSRPNPGTPTEVCRTAEFAVVGEIDAGSNYVYLTDVIRESYTTGRRLAKLSKKQIKIHDLTMDITDAGYAAGYNEPMLEVQAAWWPLLENVHIKRGYAMGVVMRGCYSYRIDKLSVDWLPNELVVYRRGYGVCDISSEYGVVDGMAAGTMRHSYTTATDVIVTGADPMSYGRSAHTRIVNGTSVGASHSGWDTHEDAFDVVFVDCVATAAYAGVTGAGAGFTIRGHDCGIIRGKAFNCQYGFYPSTQFVGSTNGIILDHCEAIGCTLYGLYPNADTGMQVQNLTVIGGVYEGRTNGLMAIRADVKLIDRPTFRIIPSPTPASAAYCVRATTSSNITADSMDIDLSQSNATDNIAFRLESSSTAMGVDNVEVFGGSNPIFRVWHGASTPGNVDARNWVLSTAPTNNPIGMATIKFEWRVRGSATVGSGLVEPKITQVIDTNGNVILDLSPTASAVNYLQLANAAVSGELILRALGADTNISLTMKAKGSGGIVIRNGSDVRIAQFNTVTSAVNRVEMTASVTGAGPTIAPGGSDTDIDLNLAGKGAGVPKIGGVAIATTASTVAAANAIAPTRTSTATAAGTTTLTNASTQVQVFTGTTTQTVKLPTTSVLAGQTWTIINNSTGNVTVQSSGANTILVVPGSRSAVFLARIDTPTAAADWDILSSTLTTGTGGSAVTGAAILRDTNGNAYSDNTIALSTATATAAGTTTLDINARQVQVFTGSTTQTVLLPTSSVLVGQIYTIINQSSGTVTVQSSGANTIDTVAAGAGKQFLALATTPTTAAHWRSI